ncbi:casein kinase II subunit beta, putative [Entamoeba invadens IP1]|uniref:Casein kinase II subunit beta n=1 Tax=Entamoeba invadens IP1 TaxID=370355 RepID=A0A0A1U2Z7_ENTIV|nr:casein kinase II subunit beta, putative [Entamoeba invadens IP1]ELP88399.1 casein kinase II subunit beta, putative [Entamoeba invadens IP1]|eukprot:XP_004255170.1 casein kinase II subunit beta, putative [Entamoeba invadens IP1]
MMDKDIPGFVVDFLKEAQNKYFVQIDSGYLKDVFNTTGLEHYVHGFEDAYRLLCGEKIAGSDEYLTFCNEGARELYGLLHSRYIMTEMGVFKAKEKYKTHEFGECPRFFCNKTGLLPCSLSDIPNETKLVMYCPSCKHMYSPPKVFSQIDGAYFGKSFAHLFVMTNPDLVTKTNPQQIKYQPSLFGFKMYTGEISKLPSNFSPKKSFFTKIQ